jgi:oligopeptide transport system substrate-binding protein
MVAIGSEYNGLRGVIPAHQVDSEDWPRLGYDPRRARELLSEAGWRVPGSTEGREIPTLEILHPSGSTSSLVAQWLQLAWKRELGLDSTIQTLEWRSFLDVQRAVDYDISRSNWIADYPDPATFLTLFTSDSPNSRTGWSDSQYDRSVALALAEADPELRMQLWQQAEKILLERGPVLPLWSMTSGNLVSEDVTGFFANPLDQHDLRAIGRRSR